MGVRYVKYRRDTGEILATGACSNEEQCALQIEDPEHEGILLNVSADDATQWIDEHGAVVDRPALGIPEMATIAADGVGEVSGALPAGTVVRFNGGTTITDAGAFGFTTDIPGVYVFEFEPPFPLLPHTLTIEATNAV